MITVKTITLIGAGNVATHLGKALLNNGISINEVYSKSIANASFLASVLNASACNNIQDLNTESDLYLICIKDDCIESVVKQFAFTDKIVVHTSGSVPMDVLSKFDHYGIFYPLQTFSKKAKTNITEVPFCIEGINNETEQTLFNLGEMLSDNVHLINSEQRKKIHLAAIFACNFSNYMYSISETLLNQNNIDFEILKPLIIETAKKIQHNSAKSMQTGPAKRNDEAVIKNHLKMLADDKDYQDIYKLITDNIIKGN